MARQVTITLPDDVYDELGRRVGQEHISEYVERLVLPHMLSESDLAEGYRAMAADQDREREALEWIEASPKIQC